ncbi:MFS transporter [Streptococcus sp. X16XC17]|uniref:ABC transporter permease n=1 Tax=unclassified Streptococcus TaxID=2608887 RepID=UPI00066FD891|nr:MULTISPECIES: hypothetical protein [unclassified Streptococcus]TCD45433.1 MFS transporter [Streptococcus sp. X16XC17]
MKKWTHLYVFLILSGISSLYRSWTVFMSKFDEAGLRSQFEAAGIPIDNEMISFSNAAFQFQTNIVNKILAVILVVALIVAAVFLIQKKFETASYTYIGYLFGTLILSTYSFIGTRGLTSIYTDVTVRNTVQATMLGGYALNIVLFIIYFGLIIFFHMRKPKAMPTLEQNATDI